MDASTLAYYPKLINTRDLGREFETDGLLPYVESRGLKARLVMFDGVYEKPDWFKPANRFRHGNQSNMLIWDRHTELYRTAGPEEKARLEGLNAP